MPLSTLLAQGTAKHRLTPLQQADLETKQEEVAAQRNTAALEPHPKPTSQCTAGTKTIQKPELSGTMQCWWP